MMFLSQGPIRTVALLAVLVSVLSGAETEKIIQKARSYLGTEDALEAVRSVHFVGNLIMDNDDKGDIDIIFQKPYRQRIVAVGKQREITALDDYEGWSRVEDLKDPNRWRMNLLSRDVVKRLRANTWENLSFFKGIERKGGRIEDLGTAEVGGRPAHKLSFIHETGSVFTRYFDQETGKLLLTETEQSGAIREEGEIVAGGVRFPKKIITVNKLEGGKERAVTIEFKSVTVNEPFADDMFAVPQIVPPAPRS